MADIRFSSANNQSTRSDSYSKYANLFTNNTDGLDDQLSVWCWPCCPKEYEGPLRFTSESLSHIPVGSLYFASRKGPISEISAHVTGSLYDVIGIVYQSRIDNRIGTYIYTVDTTFMEGQHIINRVVSLNLQDLIKDDTIIHHGILPLKDFADCDDENCRNSKEWRKSLYEKRIDIFKELFKKYNHYKSEHEPYRSLASLTGFPVSDSYRNKNTFTPSELIGLILYQAGLIWDGNFLTGFRNPILNLDKFIFPKCNSSHSATITITTPRVEIQKLDPKTDDSEVDFSKFIRINSDQKQNYKFGENIENDNDDSDIRIKNNIQRYLDETRNNYRNEKGSDSEDEFDELHSFRCHYSNEWPEPVEKHIYSRTILFGSLRPVDFLIDYYQHIGIYQHDYNIMDKNSPNQELLHMIKPYLHKDHFNKLNMCWYHNNLIPIEISNEINRDYDNRVEREYRIMKDLIIRLNKDFVQKRMLHVNEIFINRNRLNRICDSISQLSGRLHNLAIECNTVVNTNGQSYNLENYEDQGEYKFKMMIHDNNNYELTMSLYRYMWGKDWKYEWNQVLNCTRKKHYELNYNLKKLITHLVDLKHRIPNSCMFYELIICLIQQTHKLYRYICNRYNENKGEVIDKNEIVSEFTE